MKQIFLTLKFFDAIDHLPTREEVLDFFVTKNLSRQYKRDELNSIISDLIKSREVVLFEDLYLGLPDSNFEIRKAKQLEKIMVSKLILKKLKKHKKIFNFIDSLDLFGLFGKYSEINLIILNEKLSPLHRFILKLMKIKDPLIIYESDLRFKSGDIRSAFYLLKMPHAYSKPGVYEKFIFKNPWIFEYFGNYPVDKISLSYKVVI
ncbi:hypothetical protein CO058_03315 [candidate division WWE3 bacterium CG_4_9_14_0_2_um_filter_35_11]|uniref:Uncharacterized protein n=1 Tax=candidate division WWE3 bacterium CG_4_9_14_0_2_um_filter_35_11 TaxID=1975077 RepID=A0A2M8EL18_UNCKA|nr:MAG: hypothetical protein COV25_00710 [candidate division WWE3 bacterium CG10_big_fil_rev_8_21_14_0_10_35_32]PJC23436.1 MAG: hypothetical protein CO058_03315 [candidate division WWE3 bacterium CG_4_9_14_0_2_um_filter_35_11]